MSKLKSLSEFQVENSTLKKEALIGIKGGLANADSVKWRYRSTCTNNTSDCDASTRTDDCSGSYTSDWGAWIPQASGCP